MAWICNLDYSGSQVAGIVEIRRPLLRPDQAHELSCAIDAARGCSPTTSQPRPKAARYGLGLALSERISIKDGAVGAELTTTGCRAE